MPEMHTTDPKEAQGPRAACARGSRRVRRMRSAWLALGPGLVVMLAGTEVGSVITVARSGARWGYRLLLLQFLIIPLLYATQELATRLALCTGRGFGELILQRLGRPFALPAMCALWISCFGALVTQFSGLAGVASLLGVPAWITTALVCSCVFAMVWTGSYRSVERVAMALGAFELSFIVVAWRSHPDLLRMRAQLLHMPLRDPDFLYLLAANLGTSIMPWAVFYQQSALIDKGQDLSRLKPARLDALIGAVVCQLVTVGILVAAAAAFSTRSTRSFEDVAQLATAFGAVLGTGMGEAAFALALSAGALVATLVVSLCAAWALGEILGLRHSLADHPRDAPWFYLSFGAMLLGAGALVVSGLGVVRLSLATGVINAALLPLVLGLLYWLARHALPPAHRLRGWWAWAVGFGFVLAGGLGLYASLAGSLSTGA